jgi:hypothetical protein
VLCEAGQETENRKKKGDKIGGMVVVKDAWIGQGDKNKRAANGSKSKTGGIKNGDKLRGGKYMSLRPVLGTETKSTVM